MRHMSKLLRTIVGLLVIAVLLPVFFFAKRPAYTIMNPDCYKQFGVSLSGAEWEPSYHPTVDELSYYSHKGVRVIRLPLGWQKLQPSLYGKLNQQEVDWLTSYIKAAYSKGITVVVDIHLYQRLNDLNFGPTLLASFSDFWRKLATALEGSDGRSGICGLDLANEPDHDPGFTNGQWPSQANQIIHAIRQVDNDHYIFVNEDHWSSSKSWDGRQAEQIKDPALVYEAHSYWDVDESGYYSPDSPPQSETDAKNLATQSLSPFVQWCAAGHRCFVGEFGVPADKEWLSTLDYALRIMRDNTIGGTYWAGGPEWGDYHLSIEPNGDGTDRPQMKILEKYLSHN